jgi:ABC-type branched-subunit amino acid transport system ATPase component
MSILAIKRLTVKFGGLTAVDRLDLEIPAGQIVSLIGPNGAGKTTVFNVVTGIHEPAAGEIQFAGRSTVHPFRPATAWLLAGFAAAMGLLLFLLANLQPVWDHTIVLLYQYRQPFPWAAAARAAVAFLVERPGLRVALPVATGALLGGAGALAVWLRYRRAPEVAARHGIARTFQNVRLFGQMTALDNVLLGMERRLETRFWHAALRLPAFWREQRSTEQAAREVLRFVGLTDHAHTLADNLAYGHQRRLEIARALAMEPRLLLLDEPAAGMNTAESQELMQLIRRLRDRGITVLLIEHDMQVVMAISDHIAVLDYGEKIAEGAPDAVRTNPQVIEAYLGAPHGDER